MSQLLELYLVVVFLYAFEAIFLIVPGALVVKKHPLRAWHRVSLTFPTSFQLGNFSYWFSGIFPFSRVLVGAYSPFCYLDAGVLSVPSHSFPSPAPPPLFVPWSDVMELKTDTNKLLLGGAELFASFPSPAAAQAASLQLISLSALSPAQRNSARKKWLSDIFDLKAAEALRDSLKESFQEEVVLNTALGIFLLVVFPITTIVFPFTFPWWKTFTLLGLLCTATAALHAYNSKKFGRFSGLNIFLLFLFPVSATRSAQRFIAHSFSGFHPLTIAKISLPEEEVAKLCWSYLRDLRHPVGLARIPEPLREAVEEFREELRLEMERRAAEWKLPCGNIPAPSTSSMTGYCPRCHGQFTRSEGLCSDCGEISLIRF